MACCASASWRAAVVEKEARERNRSMAAASPCWASRSRSLACFLRCSRFGFSGNSRDISPLLLWPDVRLTGRSEVDVRTTRNQVGSSLPADGVHPECSSSLCDQSAKHKPEPGRLEIGRRLETALQIVSSALHDDGGLNITRAGADHTPQPRKRP